MSPTIRRSRPPILTCTWLCGLVAGLSACDSPITESPAGLFPVRVYGTGFENPSFVPGILDGQDGWFAGLGQGAITVSGHPQARQGQQGLMIDGSRLQEFFGFYLGGYARPLNYVPLDRGTPVIVVSGYLRLSAEAPPTTGLAVGLTGTLNGEYTANILIGVREQDGRFVSYLSNYDGVSVNGPLYGLGEWGYVRAIFDFKRRTVHGFFNGSPMGEVPFTNGIDNQAAFVNIAMGGNQPLGNVTASIDNLSVIAAPLWPLPD
jgi:hypothetical protein